MRVDALNALPAADAERALLGCCGSTRWAQRMAEARPFATAHAAGLAADTIWATLDRADWLEAFAAHPRIGARPDSGSSWSAAEQSGVGPSSREAFERLNRDYEARFGHVFIVCATGRSGAEMEAIIQRRMGNNPDDELREAAEQQRQITRLRLAKLLT
jgi:OHCU decarboxylase